MKETVKIILQKDENLVNTQQQYIDSFGEKKNVF